MDNTGETLPSKRFALVTQPLADSDFARIHDYLVDTVIRESIRLRTKCAQAYGISFFETMVDVAPDPDRPNVVTITARPLAIVLTGNVDA